MPAGRPVFGGEAVAGGDGAAVTGSSGAGTTSVRNTFEQIFRREDVSAVYIEGLHMCMAARGVGAHEARLVTSGVRGVFLEHESTRQEFIKLALAPQITVV